MRTRKGMKPAATIAWFSKSIAVPRMKSITMTVIMMVCSDEPRGNQNLEDSAVPQAANPADQRRMGLVRVCDRISLLPRNAAIDRLTRIFTTLKRTLGSSTITGCGAFNDLGKAVS